MAMHLRTAQKTPPASSEPAAPSAGKHDAYVAAQLRRAEVRIRTLDVVAALLGFFALTGLLLGAAALADSCLPAFTVARPFVLPLYFLAAAVFLGLTLARPLLRRINPYYTAVHMERTTPGSKNSVVNWLDLHDTKLPPAIRNALGQRAAKDLARVDVEKAFSGKRTAWLGGLAGGVFALLLAQLFWFGPSEFFFHLRRSFAPAGVRVTRTTLTISQPVGGNATVTAGKAVRISVDVSGKIPEAGTANAVMLHYRYDPDEPYTTTAMQQDATGEWSHSFSAFDVQNGFYYKVSGGDAETPDYQITVQSSPLITAVEANYHYPGYAARPDTRRAEARPIKIEVLRGTTVTLLAGTNRSLKDAYIEFQYDDKVERLPAKVTEKNSKWFSVQFVADHSATYRLHFISTENELNEDARPQQLIATPDQPPDPVELTVPGKDTELPCNELLQLEGLARDDIGVKSLTLQMQIVNSSKLQGQKYRSDAELALPGGGYPRTLTYKDAIDLAKVQTAAGAPARLTAGMELEYWLEARDACDYPQPDINVSESKHYRVKLLPPETDQKKLQNERDQAKQEKEQHEQRQDEQLKKENQQREQDNKNQQREQGDKSEKPNSEQSDRQPAEGGKDSKTPSKDQQQKDNQVKNQAEQILNRGNKPDRGEKSSAKEDSSNPGQPKGSGSEQQPQPGDAKQEPNKPKQKQAGNAKGAGEQKPGKSKEPAGSGKADGSQPMEQKGDGKNEGQQQPMEGGPGETKSRGQVQKPQPASESKDNASPQQKQDASATKPDQGNSNAGEAKANDKGGDPSGSRPENSAGSPKGKSEPVGKSQEKAAGNPNADNGPKGADKEKATTGQGDQPDATKRPADAKGGSGDQNRADSKGDTNNDTKAASGGNAATKDNPKNSSAGNADAANKPKTDGDKKIEDGMAKTNPGNATKKDVENATKGLASNNADTRQKAEESLNKIKDQAKDPEVRKQAENALRDKANPERSNASNAADGPKTPEDQKIQDGMAKTDAGNATKKDVENAAKGLASNNADTRQKAEEGLNKIKDQAKDPEVRKQAENALQNKPKPEKSNASNAADAPKTPEDQKIEDAMAKTDAGNATKRDVENAAKGLASNNADTRQKAEESLNRIKDQAKDPEVRKQAENALEKERQAGQPPANPGDSKGAPGDKNDAPATEKKQGSGDQKNSAEPKSEPKIGQDRPSDNKDVGKPEKPNDGSKEGSGKPNGPAEAKGSGQPGAELPGKRNDPGSAQQPEPPPLNEKGNKSPAGALTLEDVRKKLDKQTLDELKWTEEDKERFLKDLAEALKRDEAAKPKVAAPQQGGALPTIGAHQIKPGDRSDHGSRDTALPPPEYRSAYPNFLQDLNKSDKKDK